MKRAAAFFFLLACSGLLLGDSPDSRRPPREPASFLQDLVRLTNAGFSEETVLVYAKAHRIELPSVVSAEDLLWLREKGVSETVIGYLVAIDVRASDEGGQEDVADNSYETAGYPRAVDSYPVSDYEGYPGRFDAGYPDVYADAFPDSYYNSYTDGYDPFYGAGYYPYPVYFFVNHSGFFGRFHGLGHGFRGHHRGDIGHGGFGRAHSPRGGFERDPGRRGRGVVVGPREPWRSASPRGSLARGFGAGRGGVVGRGGSGHAALTRGGLPHLPTRPRGEVVGHGGSGRPASAGGGRVSGIGRAGTTIHSGGGPRATGGAGGRGRR